MAAAAPKTVVVLEEKPDQGQVPLSHITLIQDRSTEKPKPKATPIVREALRAWAENVELVNQAKALEVSKDQSFSGIVRACVAQAIRFRQYQIKKQEPQTRKPAATAAGKGGRS